MHKCSIKRFRVNGNRARLELKQSFRVKVDVLSSYSSLGLHVDVLQVTELYPLLTVLQTG